ncbi:hypothetical protein RJT34_16220 [Clitoria ternatea]|uniref:FMN-dependent dehydrogenase domain-containing protein n=1 Tax=Clitoria ternatea TaxID=43366 RepID=A0AAN9J8B3_CLITE
MVCDENQTDVYIRMPAVMLSQDAGLNMERHIKNTSNVFLWLMAVGTILCASYWSAWSAREAAVEQEKHLKFWCSILHWWCRVCTCRANSQVLVPLIHHLGESTTARAASTASTIMVLKDRNVVTQLVKRVERAGFKAIALTVDTPILSRREADIKHFPMLFFHLLQIFVYIIV